MTGLVIHHAEPDLVYIRTDVGGAYRLDAAQRRWIPIANTIGALHDNFAGVESIALDPSDPDVVYVVVGMYRREQLAAWGSWSPGDAHPAALFKSTDRGTTWARLNIEPSSGANEDWRWVGERLAVDPHDGRIVLFGSRSEGLWRSSDAGSTWETVAALPLSAHPGAGVLWVAFDAHSGSPGSPTPTIYAGVYGRGVYRSTDAGATWTLLIDETIPPGLSPQRAAIATDGTLYVSFIGTAAGIPGVFKLQSDVWSNITPEDDLAYNAISVDPANPARVVVAQDNPNWGNRLFYTDDEGVNWREIQHEATFTAPWYLPEMFGAAVASLNFDPHVANRVWMTDWYNVWVTDSIGQFPSQWSTITAGHEETVVLTLETPPNGAPLISGVADVTGFAHHSITDYALHNILRFSVQDVTGIDYAEDEPAYLVAAAGRRHNNTGAGAYSRDGGDTWMLFPSTPPGAMHGKIALSSDGASIVWIPSRQSPYYSADGGTTWEPSSGIPAGTVGILWDTEHPLAADRDTPGRFYLMVENTLFRSDDGGVTWQPLHEFQRSTTVRRPIPPPSERVPEVSAWAVDEGFRMVQTLPGEVWVQLGSGLYASQDAGENFTRITGYDAMRRFALGVPAPNASRPTVFLWGIVGGVEGVYRTVDAGAAWTLISTPDVPIFSISHLRGDRQVFGRVYLGLNGRGIWVGEPHSVMD